MQKISYCKRVTEPSRMFRKEIVFLPVFVNGINCFCIHLIPPHKYLRYAHTVSAVSHCAPSNLSVPAFLSCFPSVPVHGMDHRYDTSAGIQGSDDSSRYQSVSFCYLHTGNRSLYILADSSSIPSCACRLLDSL